MVRTAGSTTALSGLLAAHMETWHAVGHFQWALHVNSEGSRRISDIGTCRRRSPTKLVKELMWRMESDVLMLSLGIWWLLLASIIPCQQIWSRNLG